MDEFAPEQNVWLRRLNATWPLFRAFGVTVRVGWTVALWAIVAIVPLAKWLPLSQAIGWGLALTLALYVTTWTHEMGHIVAGRRFGIETETMTLRALGGLAHLSAPASTPREEMIISLAGPATHLLCLAVLLPTTWLLRGAHGDDTWFFLLSGFARMQVAMLVFNLLPIYPMDGGRTLRGALATRMHVGRASYWVANAGFVGNAAFIGIGVLSWLEVADVFGFGAYGFLLAWIGVEGIQACRMLRLEAQYGGGYADVDPFQKTLMASQAAVREMEDEERAERRVAADQRRRAQETADRILDRINELGGVDKLSARERRELEEASRELGKRV